MYKYLTALILLLLPAAPAFGGWTQWFDRDNPSGTGDWETLRDLLREYPNSGLCEVPTGIECREVNGDPLSTANENVTCETSTGLICRNDDQDDGYCQDYMVRFLCEEPPPDCEALEKMDIHELVVPCFNNWEGRYDVTPVVPQTTYTWTSDDGEFFPKVGTEVTFFLDPVSGTSEVEGSLSTPPPETIYYYSMTVTAECGGKRYSRTEKFKCGWED